MGETAKAMCLILDKGPGSVPRGLDKALTARYALKECRAGNGSEGFDLLRAACPNAREIDAVIAFGQLGQAALALAIQRTVKRLALVGPDVMHPPNGGQSRPADVRFRRFVRRNLALCTADVLCINLSPSDLSILRRGLGRAELPAYVIPEAGWRTECEFSVKNVISAFLLG